MGEEKDYALIESVACECLHALCLNLMFHYHQRSPAIPILQRAFEVECNRLWEAGVDVEGMLKGWHEEAKKAAGKGNVLSDPTCRWFLWVKGAVMEQIEKAKGKREKKNGG